MSNTEFSESCRLLIALLKQHEGPPVRDLDQMSQQQKLFLSTTAAAEVMLHSLAILAAAGYANAREGLRALTLEKRLKTICAEMNAVLNDHKQN